MPKLIPDNYRRPMFLFASALARAMADATRESLERLVAPGEATIEVRDDAGPVTRVRFTVAVERIRKQ